MKKSGKPVKKPKAKLEFNSAGLNQFSKSRAAKDGYDIYDRQYRIGCIFWKSKRWHLRLYSDISGSEVFEVWAFISKLGTFEKLQKSPS